MTHHVYTEIVNGRVTEVHTRLAPIPPGEPNGTVRELDGRLYAKVAEVDGRQGRHDRVWISGGESGYVPGFRNRSKRTDSEMSGSVLRFLPRD